MTSTFIVNLFGSTATGKEHMAFALVMLLRQQGFKTEYVQYMKHSSNAHQIQLSTISDLIGKVNFIVLSNPLPITKFTSKQFNNINILLESNKMKHEQDVKNLFQQFNLTYHCFKSGLANASYVSNAVSSYLKINY